MFPRSRRIVVTLAATAALAGGAVAHAATSSSGTARSRRHDGRSCRRLVHGGRPRPATARTWAVTTRPRRPPRRRRRRPPRRRLQLHHHVLDGRLNHPCPRRLPRRHVGRPRGAARLLPPPASRAARVASLLVLLALVAAAAAVRAAHASATVTGTVDIGQGLRGPAGLEATVYARGLPNVSAFALDARGRLWATTSAASDHRGDGVYLIPRAGASQSR